MMKTLFSATVLFVLALASADAAELTVVELYTSQGCSSCVPADKLLAKLAERRDILAMSLPVTYWDMLGWKDTLATDANTKRQKSYAKAMGRGGVYTPQMIINGSVDVVGSRADDVKMALAAAGGKDRGDEIGRCSVAVGVAAKSSNSLHIAIPAAPPACRRANLAATIWIFSLRDGAKVKVDAGENKGKCLKYRNLVVGIASAGAWRGESVSLTVPLAQYTPQGSAAVVVQQNGYGKVLGAAYLPGLKYYARQ
jgi:hypothetical protein